MSSVSQNNSYQQKQSKSQKNQRDDHLIEETVKQLGGETGKKISWKKVSQLIYKRFSIQISIKKCQRRYFSPKNRWKNYIHKKVNPQLIVEQQVREKIFFLHICGMNRQQIQKELNLSQMNETKFKNIIRVIKQSMGRVLKSIYNQKVKEVNIPQNLFTTQKDHFRIFSILFSTSQLLNYYRTHSNRPINVIDFRKLTIQYDQLKKQCLKLKNKTNSGVGQKYQEAMLKKEAEIKTTLERILGLYESIYTDKQKLKLLIGNKDKNLDNKFRYLKAILLNIPIKVIQGIEFIKEQPNLFFELGIESRIMKNQLEPENNLFRRGQAKEEFFLKQEAHFFDFEQEDDGGQHLFYPPFQTNDSI